MTTITFYTGNLEVAALYGVAGEDLDEARGIISENVEAYFQDAKSSLEALGYEVELEPFENTYSERITEADSYAAEESARDAIAQLPDFWDWHAS